jgi:hypothetical protein
VLAPKQNRGRSPGSCTEPANVYFLPDEKRYTATAFWVRAVRAFRLRGIRVERVLTDNGGAYRSRLFRKACRWLGIPSLSSGRELA